MLLVNLKSKKKKKKFSKKNVKVINLLRFTQKYENKTVCTNTFRYSKYRPILKIYIYIANK